MTSFVSQNAAAREVAQSPAMDLAVRGSGGSRSLLWRDLARCSNEEARARLPLDVAYRYRALPLALIPDSLGGEQLLVVMADPGDAETLTALRFAAGCDLSTDTAPAEEIEKAIFAAYRGGALDLEVRVGQAVADLTSKGAAPENDLLNAEPPADGGIPAILESLLSRAVSLCASDIHLEPYRTGLTLRLRVDGLLRTESAFLLPAKLGAELIRRIKVLARIDTTGQKRVADGAFSFERPGAMYRVRVSILPQIYGEKAVLRLLELRENGTRHTHRHRHQSAPEEDLFSPLGLTPDQSAHLRAALGHDSGIILLAGPTGSGKSTLLYAALEALRSPWRCIVTVEDPVERIVTGVSQMDLSQTEGLSYEDVLPPLMRQDPDVVMVGEIRETRSARLAFEAAITGHLLLSTVHAGDCLQAVLRVLELTRNPELVAHALRLVIASRLIPRICTGCRSAEQITPELALLFQLPPDTQLWSGSGCAACGGFGFRGRIGAFEVLTAGEKIRAIIAQSGVRRLPQRSRLFRAARNAGYKPLAHGVRRLLLEGCIAPFHALRSLGIAPEAAGYHVESDR